MYEKIAQELNTEYGSIDISADDVERFLRFGDAAYITNDEIVLIDSLLNYYL